MCGQRCGMFTGSRCVYLCVRESVCVQRVQYKSICKGGMQGFGSSSGEPLWLGGTARSNAELNQCVIAPQCHKVSSLKRCWADA